MPLFITQGRGVCNKDMTINCQIFFTLGFFKLRKVRKVRYFFSVYSKDAKWGRLSLGNWHISKEENVERLPLLIDRGSRTISLFSRLSKVTFFLVY